MTELNELLNDLADTPMPPSPFDADQVFAAGARRRQRRRKLLPLSAVAAVIALVAAGVTTAVAVPGDDIGPPAVVGSRPDATTPAGIIQWAGAADPVHLYLAYLHCAVTPCRKDVYDLYGSDDGGQTWTLRTSALQVGQLRVVGAGRLVKFTGERYAASDDGGRTWNDVTVAPGKESGVPDGQIAVCRPVDATAACRLYTVDVAGLRMAPLAAQPPIKAQLYGVHDAGGRLWVTGVDPGSGRAAVATSDDRGRTWTAHSFDVSPRCAVAPCFNPDLATTDGRTVYVTLNAVSGSSQAVYRWSSDSGWQRLDRGKLPLGGAGSWSFVTADGAHVVCVYSDARENAPSGCRFWMLGVDGVYRQAALDGLPESVYPVERTPDGWYYTFAAGQTRGMYGSIDGRQWSPVLK